MESLKTWLRSYGRTAPVTLGIAAVNILIFLITAVQALSWQNLHLTALGEKMILIGAVAIGVPMNEYRVFSAAFLHLDAGHLAVNMFLLLLIGREIERFLGSKIYCLVYLLGVLGSSLAIIYFDPAAPTAGASGAIYCLMAVFIGVVARQNGDLRAPIVLVAINVAYTFLAGNVSLWGHLGGLVVGLLLMGPVTYRNRSIQWLSVVIAAVVVAGFIGAMSLGIVPGQPAIR